jgi:hypothetical protein
MEHVEEMEDVANVKKEEEGEEWMAGQTICCTWVPMLTIYNSLGLVVLLACLSNDL